MECRTIGLIVTVALSLLVTPMAADTQPSGLVLRSGVLSPASPAVALHFLEAFRQGIRDLAYVEGQTIAMEYRYAEGQCDRLP